MTVELITGHAGSAHISAADDGWQNVGAFGSGKYVLDTGTQFAAEVQNANLVTIGVGDAMFEGRHVRVSATENVAIDNGAQGMNRNDIICIKYEYDSGTDVETASLEVVKGTASSSTPSDPTIPSGSILDSDSTAYMPLWRIPIEGITVGTPVKLYGDVVVTLAGMLTKTWTASQIPNISASKITSGTLDAARIPNIDASKVTSGTFADGRIPNLAASKITSGTFSADRIPNLAATKITSGTLGVDRIPTLTAAKIPNLDTGKLTSGTLGVARGGTGKSSGTVYMVDVLYNNSSGTTGSVTLSASAANYTELEIMYRSTNDDICNSVRVYSPNNKYAQMVAVAVGSNAHMVVKSKVVKISGTTIEQYGYAGYTDLQAGTYTAQNGFYIHKVLGYK